MKLKRFKIGVAVLAALYVLLILVPAGTVLFTTTDGTVDEVESMIENRTKLLNQWSPITGLWGADWK